MSTPSPIRPKWSGTMTDRERFTRQLHRQPVDRCYNMEFGYWKENFEQWPMFRDNGITNNADADPFLNFDVMQTVHGNAWMHPYIEQRTIEETATSRIIINPEGLLAEVPKDDHSTIPHFLRSSIEEPEDWERFKDQHLNVDHPARTLDVEAMKAQHPDDHEYVLAVHVGSMIGKVRDLLTVEGLAYATADYPEMVEDMVETSCQLIEKALDQILPNVACDVASSWEDICYNAGPLVSLDFFRSVVVPRYKRIKAKLLEHGVDLWYLDCDGDVRHLIPDFLDAGVNVMFPWEVNGAEHPGEALDRWGPELRIMGGVDKMKLGEGPEAIRRYLDTLVPYVEQGGYIPFCDHRCPPNVKQEDYLFYLDLKEELFGMG